MEQDNTLLTPGEEKEVATPAEVEQTQEQTPEMVEDTERTETPAVDTSKFSTRELLDYLSEMVNREELPELQDMKRLKRMINHQEPVATDEAELDETEENGEEKNEEGDDMMILFINLRSRYHELQAKKDEEEKAEREDNYKRKLELISRLEANLESTDDFFKVRNEFENIRNEWKNIGRVPENLRSELLSKYSTLLEKHYEINKLNKEAQEYDFKHNRTEKESFIEKARALADEPDVVKAFKELQTLHDMWKETGPVAPEFRDSMWKDFKDASTVINKRHDDYFKELREKEEQNYTHKMEIIEKLENMLVTLPTSRAAWHDYEDKMEAIRKEWKGAGRVPKGKLNEVNMRFRVAVDEFYLQRRTFLRELSEEITPKLERMREIVAEAEELKDSTEWQSTSDKLKNLQKEWTTISKLGTRVGEAQKLWRRFRKACDVFFEQKKANYTPPRRASREENLVRKQEIADKIEALEEQRLEDPSAELAAIEAEWASVGPVPDDQKGDVLNRYYGALRRLKGEEDNRRRTPRRRDDRRGNNRRGGNEPRRDFKARSVDFKKELGGLSHEELSEEVMNIDRNVTHLEEERLQYENNIGFFNASPDNPMVMQIQRKIDDLTAKIEKLQARKLEVVEAGKKSSAPAKDSGTEE
ncbi:DUF349 domain-containing protein [Porphyromonas levii]|uniref:DUF349 domain-containing protein n=1 Tax=Porphyromonas levii TaxID=28114 RepID=A0A4Y8WPL6_9PORP|nr:DUF349 domain-containing protein [Porphyromonas levii]MBR8702678.1 hypothetical protein [Porphyromonas levii]MBR8731442.1 hypothetical protein [Porphyromonas levii]MBR8759440.1 hypothetical protein [Porphyromonas levii]MBR8783890.1 hypothetical protein [Porphyromonas levii]TFH95059.1 DUF349 domain-containing protein [Porphyromonas levii]